MTREITVNTYNLLVKLRALKYFLEVLGQSNVNNETKSSRSWLKKLNTPGVLQGVGRGGAQAKKVKEFLL